jgi:hypothetical protein
MNGVFFKKTAIFIKNAGASPFKKSENLFRLLGCNQVTSLRKVKAMTSELAKLEQLDEHLVCANVAGRKRLGVLGVVSLPTSDDERQNHVMFYDFIQNEQEPLLPVGVIQSTQEIECVFRST